MKEIEEFWYKEDVTTMLNKTPTQVNFANIEVNYLKKVRARKERDSQENFKCNQWGYRCAREFLWGWIFAHMLLLASGLQWKMQLLKAFCVQKKNINNWIFMDFKSSDDLQWSIKNCKTSNKLTVNMPQIIIQGKLFKDEHFILWKRNDEKIKLPSLGQKRKNHLHQKAESKSNKGCTVMRDRNPCTFCKNAEITDNSDKWAFVVKARKINLDLRFWMGLLDLCVRAMRVTQNRRPLVLADRFWS